MAGSHERSCAHQEQTVAWALHATEPGEEVEVLAHLPGCAICRDTVREAEETLGLLGAALPQEEPPPALRARLLDAVAHTPQDSSRPVLVETIPAPRRPARGFRTRFAGALVAAAVAVAAIVGLGVQSANLKSERDAQAARAQALVQMVQGLAQPGTTHAFLAPSAGGPVVAAVMNTAAGPSVLPISMTANPTDHVYVLWGLPAGSAPVPLGTFDVHDGAGTPESVGSAAGGAGFAQFAISLEPGRVAPATPTDVVASGRVEV